MHALLGTKRLLRLGLRLDRIKLPIWIVANVGLVLLTLPQLKAAYGSAEQQVIYAAATAPSIVTRLFGGALTGPSLGEITIIETYMLIVLLMALMNIFLVVRHTRQNEETNRSELLGSLIVGRQAALTTALIMSTLASFTTAALLFIAFLINGYDINGALAYCLSLGCIGMVFAGVASITAQLFESARAASGMAGLAFGVSYLIKNIGDAFGTLTPDKLGVNTHFLSWLSPLGWSTNMRPFAGERWWALGLYGVLIIALIIVAYVLLGRRDVGGAIFTPKPGRLHAKASLLKQFGLIWRLNRVNFYAWVGSFIVIGATLGAVANEFKDLIAGNEEMQKLLETIGGRGSDPADIMFSTTLVIAAIAASGYALQVLTRLKTEESSGRLELLISTKKSRVQVLSTQIIFALTMTSIMLGLTGLSAGVVYGIIADDFGTHTIKLTLAAMIHLPSIAVLIGASAILFGMLPRLFVGLTWALLAGCLLIVQLGALLNLPQIIMNISPFTHTPIAPAASISVKPLILQTIVALALLLMGTLLFKRRDITSS